MRELGALPAAGTPDSPTADCESRFWEKLADRKFPKPEPMCRGPEGHRDL